MIKMEGFYAKITNCEYSTQNKMLTTYRHPIRYTLPAGRRKWKKLKNLLVNKFSKRWRRIAVC
jgi:hypothetical protein